MRTSSTFSILFWIYAKRTKNNKAPLYARISVDRKKLNISLKRRIDTRLWNPQKERVKGTTGEARHINQYLDEVYANLFQCYQELRTEDRGQRTGESPRNRSNPNSSGMIRQYPPCGI